ncbi:MAG: hypothetical protein FWH08_03950 [Oscillospiraceae bacterium]|nr:hypothetical protein [Oscillospiraceae bacterium]
MSRNYFAGANTPDGFFSYFDHIITLEKTNKKVYIKGGSGTGKSTLIKKTGELFEQKGHYTEYFFCSNDAESLDGVSMPKLGIAVVDATAPHPSDPQIPAATDEIFNAADFLDKSYIRQNKTHLSQMLAEKKGLYQRAYGYLGAAYGIYKLSENIFAQTLNEAALNKRVFELLSLFDGIKPGSHNARDRKLFATAITPEGIKSVIHSALAAEKIYLINGMGVTGTAETLFDLVQRYANFLGMDTVSFKSPLEPQKTEHLLIPALNAAFITSNRYHELSGEISKQALSEEINLEEFSDPAILEKYSGELSYNGGLFDELLQKAIRTMAASKDIHLKVEAIYAEGMDFKRMHRAYNKVLEELSE